MRNFFPILLLVASIAFGYTACESTVLSNPGTPERKPCGSCGAEIVAESDAAFAWCDVCHRYVTPKP